MSCIFRISGEDLDIDKLIASTKLVPDKVYRRGEPRFGHGQKKANSDSGASFVVSLAEVDEFEAQKNGARIFLADKRDDLRKIMKWPGVCDAWLDFGIKKYDVPAQFEQFDPELLKAAGDLGVGIEISLYTCEE
jgi:hypothetical protein